MVQPQLDDDICDAVQGRASLPGKAEATELVQGVLQALAYVLPPEQIAAACACLPGDLHWCLRCGPATPDPLIDSELFLGWVMSSLETTGGSDRTLGGEDPLASLAADEARYRVQLVLEELWRRMDAEQARACAACLPPGLADAVDPRRRK
ncbi:MAG: DUF2267 domain-containing protein [Chloroflexi bacterium]|nr:DUF2267 domain-containing protein [Chloroflexota bacterium]